MSRTLDIIEINKQTRQNIDSMINNCESIKKHAWFASECANRSLEILVKIRSRQPKKLN